MANWRNELLDEIVALLKTIPGLCDVKVLNSDVLDLIAKGGNLRAPFALVQYTGFSSEALGEKPKREMSFSIICGVNALRKEEAAFKGEDAPAADYVMTEILQDIEEKCWGHRFVTGYPGIVGDESFGFYSNNLLVFEQILQISAIMKL